MTPDEQTRDGAGAAFEIADYIRHVLDARYGTGNIVTNGWITENGAHITIDLRGVRVLVQVSEATQDVTI